jgi:hypothetical protein
MTIFLNSFFLKKFYDTFDESDRRDIICSVTLIKGQFLIQRNVFFSAKTTPYDARGRVGNLHVWVIKNELCHTN